MLNLYRKKVRTRNGTTAAQNHLLCHVVDVERFHTKLASSSLCELGILGQPVFINGTVDHPSENLHPPVVSVPQKPHDTRPSCRRCGVDLMIPCQSGNGAGIFSDVCAHTNCT